MQDPSPWHLGSKWREVMADTTTVELFLGLTTVGQFDSPPSVRTMANTQSAQDRASTPLRQFPLLANLQRAVESMRVMPPNEEAANGCR